MKAVGLASTANPSAYPTPYELRESKSNHRGQLIAIVCYQRLALDFPGVLEIFQIGVSDGGVPMHAGVITADGVFDRAQLKAEGRPVFFQ